MNWFNSNLPTVFEKNWKRLTGGGTNVVIFSGDQKLEHLHNDFYGPNIDRADNNPEHMFQIANTWLAGNKPGGFATHLGLIEQYGQQYTNIPYIVKLNGMTHTVPVDQKEPYSAPLWSVEDVVAFADEHQDIAIVGVACTLYVGSEYEPEMLTHAAQMVRHAHEAGLIAVLFVYPRGKAITDQHDGNLLAGCAGLAATLGADIVKLNPPEKDATTWLPIITETAGTTRVVFSGGAQRDAQTFLTNVTTYINHGAAGVAVGRNIHQRSVREAVALLHNISTIVYRT